MATNKAMLEKMKTEVASEVGVSLGGGYNGDIKARDAGRIGGNMVKKMIQYAQNNMK
jgi:hypothetical protein